MAKGRFLSKTMRVLLENNTLVCLTRLSRHHLFQGPNVK